MTTAKNAPAGERLDGTAEPARGFADPTAAATSSWQRSCTQRDLDVPGSTADDD
jgi:hypothetical protein